MVPFRLEVPAEQLDDLRERLRRTRWPEAATVDDWSQGVPLAYAKDLCGYWATAYDWRAFEARLNAVPQFRATLDGLDFHVLHARSPHPGALPLLLTHGWPGSVVEFLDLIGPLTDPPDPADAFHVVCPSLPGFGFSGRPDRAGWGIERIAAAWAELMDRLGYGRYGAQGGDWGSFVTAALGHTDPEHLAGIHLTLPVAPAVPGLEPTEHERAGLAATRAFRDEGSGYSAVQSTRPQTIGYGLLDSPAAQCTWIAEKFHAWTDCDGDLESVIARDTLLDNVTTYWLGGTGASSARLYWEGFPVPRDTLVHVPTGCSIFPKELVRLPRRWCERRFTDLRYWNDEIDRGGHFASLEQPAVFLDEVRAFFRLVR
jgi:pimeloyl-ACP methyl ester carboxylesterase